MPNPLLCLDLETTGLDPLSDQVLEIGAIIDVDGQAPVEELPTFQCLVIHARYHGDSFALQMNQHILQELSGVRPTEVPIYEEKEAALALKLFLQKHLPAGEKYTPCGKNFGGFDRPFLQELSGYGDDVVDMLHYRVIDPGNLYWQPDVDGWDVPSLKTCLERTGQESEVTHRALADAMDCLKLARWHRERFLPDFLVEGDVEEDIIEGELVEPQLALLTTETAS